MIRPILHISTFILVFQLVCTAQDLTQVDITKEKKYINAIEQAAIGRYDKGIEILLELYKEDRTNGAVAFELSKAYLAKNDLILAEKYGKSAIEHDNENPWYHLYYGNLMMDVKRPESAIQAFQNIIKLSPHQSINHTRLAEAYLFNNDRAGALKTYSAVEEKFGFDDDVADKQIEILKSMGNATLLKTYLDRCIVKRPNDTHYLLGMAEYHLSQKENDQANIVYKKILLIDPNHTQANLALIGQGSEVESENSYLRALRPLIANDKIPVDSKVKELIPYVDDLAKGENVALKDALLELGERLINTHPDEAKAHAIYGDVLFHTNNYQGAVDQYKKTLQLHKNNFTVWDQLMFSQAKTASYEDLLSTANAALDVYPNQVSPYYYIGVANTQLGKNKEAKEILEEALLVAGSNKAVKSKILCQIARVQINEKLTDNAKNNISMAHEYSNGANPEAFEVEGDIYLLSGNKKQAISSWNKAIEMGWSNLTILKKVEQNK